MKYKKLGLFLLMIAVFVSTYLYYSAHRFSIVELKDYVQIYGNWVPFVLLVIIVISSSVGFVFTIPVAAAALILDMYSAFIISIVGLTLGALISFLIARYIGRDYVEKRFIHKRKKLEHYDEHLEKKGFLTVFFLRLIAFIPYEIVNIVAGLSRIHIVPYMLGTLVGIMPGVLITIYFVRSTNNAGSAQFIIATVLLSLFSLIPLLSKRVRKIIFD